MRVRFGAQTCVVSERETKTDGNRWGDCEFWGCGQFGGVRERLQGTEERSAEDVQESEGLETEYIYVNLKSNLPMTLNRSPRSANVHKASCFKPNDNGKQSPTRKQDHSVRRFPPTLSKWSSRSGSSNTHTARLTTNTIRYRARCGRRLTGTRPRSTLRTTWRECMPRRDRRMTVCMGIWLDWGMKFIRHWGDYFAIDSFNILYFFSSFIFITFPIQIQNYYLFSCLNFILITHVWKLASYSLQASQNRQKHFQQTPRSLLPVQNHCHYP